MSKTYTVIQRCMSLSTKYLGYGHHVARLRRCRRRAYAPTSNAAGLDNHEKINSWVSFSFLYEYGAPFGGPSGRRSSAVIDHLRSAHNGIRNLCDTGAVFYHLSYQTNCKLAT